MHGGAMYAVCVDETMVAGGGRDWFSRGRSPDRACSRAFKSPLRPWMSSSKGPVGGVVGSHGHGLPLAIKRGFGGNGLRAARDGLCVRACLASLASSFLRL